MTRKIVLIVCLGLASRSIFAHPKTDIVVLKNGDRITGEIKSLVRGRLEVKTDAMGTASIKWDYVAGVESEYVYRLELQSGLRYVGAIQPSEHAGKLVVGDPRGQAVLDVERVVAATPIERSYFDRAKVSIDAGYDFTQASSATNWSLKASATYTEEKYSVDAELTSNVKSQEGAETTNRQNLDLSYQRYIRNRWFWTGLGQFEKSENLDLDFRGVGGVGVGRRLVRSNRNILSAFAGGVFTREKFADRDEFDSNVEAVVALDAQTFKLSSPELDLSGRVAVFPSLTRRSGRIRIQASGRARIEIVKNLYWSLSLYNNFDSAPPSETERRNDFGINSSLGWTF